MRPRSAPILPLSDLLRVAAARRQDGGVLVLANGAFDLLHVGHVRYLQAAAAQGQTLVVAVNSDASVSRAKGPSRPIIPAHERAEMVAAIIGVDFVTVFDTDTVAGIIERLRPDVHAKGTDYTADTVPEAGLVRSMGGRVAIVGDPKNHATSTLVRQLKQAPKQS